MTRKSILALILALVMVAAVFVGCTPKTEPSPSASPSTAPSEEPSEAPEYVSSLSPDDPYTFSFLWPFANQPKWVGTKIGDLVTEQTGLTIEFLNTVGDWAEYHNLLVSSRDFPDVVTIAQGNELQQYLDGDCLKPITDLVWDRAPTAAAIWNLDKNGNLIDSWINMTKAMTGEEALYFMSMAITISRENQTPAIDFYDPNLVYTPLLDNSAYFLYPEITEISDKRPTSMAEIYEIFKAYQEQFGGDGIHYATSVYATNANILMRWGNYIYGYKPSDAGGEGALVSKDDGEMVPSLLLDETKEFIMFLNKCYREGLMDPEGPLMTEENAIQNYSSGNYLNAFGNWWIVQKANVNFLNTDSMKDMTYCAVPIVRGEGYDGALWQSNVSEGVGWRMVGITEDMDKPEKFLEFIEWYYTTPGTELMFGWGFENDDYILNADGQPDVNADIVASHTGDYYYNLGLSGGDEYSYMWALFPLASKTLEGFTPNNADAPFKLEGGGDPRWEAVDADGWFWDEDYRGMFFADTTLAGIAVDPAQSDKWTLATANINDQIMSVIMAPTEAEASSLYDAARDALEASDGMDFVDYLNELYNTYKK